MGEETIIKELLELKGYSDLRKPQKMAIEAELLRTNDNFIIIAPTA